SSRSISTRSRRMRASSSATSTRGAGLASPWASVADWVTGVLLLAGLRGHGAGTGQFDRNTQLTGQPRPSPRPRQSNDRAFHHSPDPVTEGRKPPSTLHEIHDRPP